MDIGDGLSNISLAVWVSENWEGIKDFGNSNFTTALLGSLAGALGGAWGAQRIAERGKYKEKLVDELKLTNATGAVVFGMVNTLFNLKSQHLISMWESYNLEKNAFITALSKDPQAIGVQDMRALSPLNSPLGVLQTYIHERLVLKARPVALVGVLSETLQTLDFLIKQRTELIHSFKNDGNFAENGSHTYFGLPLNNRQDSRYGDLLKGICMNANNAIFFCTLLLKDLSKHCEATCELYEKTFGDCPIEPFKTDFTKAEKSGLMPDESKFSDWYSNFHTKPKKVSKFRKSMLWLWAQLKKKRGWNFCTSRSRFR